MKSLQKFVLISSPKSGSSLLKDALACQQKILVFGELFDAASVDYVKEEQCRVFGQHPYQFEGDASLFLQDWVFNPTRYDSKIRLVGFSLRYEQARQNDNVYRVWQYLLSEPSVQIIHLIRENLLESFVSLMHAVKTGSWLLVKRSDGRFVSYGSAGTKILDEKPSVPPFEVILEQVEHFFLSTAASQAWSRRVFRQHRYLEIEHSSMVENFEETVRSVFGFLGSTPVPVRKAFEGEGVGSPKSQISNYTELKDYFSKSIFSEYFDE